jgi:hypothetical protein
MNSEPSKLLLACKGRRLMAVTTKWYLAAGQTDGGEPLGLWLHFDDGNTVSLHSASDIQGLKLSIDLPTRSIDMHEGGKVEVNQQAPEAIRRQLGNQLDAVQGIANTDDDLVGVKLTLQGAEVRVLRWETSSGSIPADPTTLRSATCGKSDWDGSPETHRISTAMAARIPCAAHSPGCPALSLGPSGVEQPRRKEVFAHLILRRGRDVILGHFQGVLGRMHA